MSEPEEKKENQEEVPPTLSVEVTENIETEDKPA